MTDESPQQFRDREFKVVRIAYQQLRARSPSFRTYAMLLDEIEKIGKVDRATAVRMAHNALDANQVCVVNGQIISRDEFDRARMGDLSSLPRPRPRKDRN